MIYNSASYEDVREFLDQMRMCLTILGGYVIYDNRPKNIKFMTDMEWVKPDTKKEWLLKLDPLDYCEGPVPNEKTGLPPVWKFGKRIEGKLCYIKIFLMPKNNVYCISFHFAERNMFLPLKNVTEVI